MQTLVLIDTNDNNFFPQKIEDCDIKLLYKSNSFINRMIRKILYKIKFPFMNFIYTDWIDYGGNVDLIILFDTGNAKYILPYIKKKYSKSRIILWYWNSVSKSIAPEEIQRDGIEIWSFDPCDCEKYGFKMNTQFFIEENFELGNYKEGKQVDAFFIGTDKGRKEVLLQIKEIFEKNGINYDFHIVGDSSKIIPGFEKKYDTPLKYNEIIQRDFNSKIVVDIVSDGQNGLTLRPLEAMRLGKPLITNFQRIKDYDFYDSERIVLINELNEDNIRKLLEFEGDFPDISSYSFSNWIKRFYEEN